MLNLKLSNFEPSWYICKRLSTVLVDSDCLMTVDVGQKLIRGELRTRADVYSYKMLEIEQYAQLHAWQNAEVCRLVIPSVASL